MEREGDELTVGKMERLLSWTYERVLESHGPISSAAEIAESYRGRRASLLKDARALVRWQVAKTAGAGFAAGFGGLPTMPVALPVEMASVLIVQVRMIVAIAHLGGYDLNDDRVKTLCFLCLCGDGARTILAELGTEVTKRALINALERLPGKIIVEINKKVGFRLLTKFGERGAINLVRAIPVLGAAVGAGTNAVWTKQIGNQAIRVFEIA